MKKFRLGEPFEIWGHWWLPEKPQNRVAGKLTSHLGNLELKLLGRFEGVDINARNTVLPVIHGVGDATNFTLWRSVQESPSFKAPGSLEQTFSKMRIVAGGHFNTEADTLFSGVTFEAPQIGPWLQKLPVKRKMQEANVSYELSQFRTCLFKSEINGNTIEFGANIQTRDEQYASYGFDVMPVASIDFASPKICSESMEHVEALADLLTILVGEDVEQRAIRFRISGENSSFPFIYEFRPPKDVKLIDEHDVLVPRRLLDGSLKAVFEKWTEDRKRLSDSVALLCDVLDRERPASHVQLLLLAQSLEAFHRNVVGGEYLPKEDYEPARKALEDAIPDFIQRDHRESLKARLKYGYQLSLRKRLVELFEPMKDTVFPALDLDMKNFVRDLVDARNDFTHWEQDREKERPNGAHLANLLSNARALTQLVLLRHLGVNESVVVQRMLTSPWRHLRRYQNIG